MCCFLRSALPRGQPGPTRWSPLLRLTHCQNKDFQAFVSCCCLGPNFSKTPREVIVESRQNVLPGEMRIAEQDRDDVLLLRAARGDEEAFTLLYRRHQAAMY